MAKSVGYGVIGLSLVLLGILIVVPLLKKWFPQYYYEGFNAKLDCVGVTCEEGQFCQENKCLPIYVP